MTSIYLGTQAAGQFEQLVNKTRYKDIAKLPLDLQGRSLTWLGELFWPEYVH